MSFGPPRPLPGRATHVSRNSSNASSSLGQSSNPSSSSSSNNTSSWSAPRFAQPTASARARLSTVNSSSSLPAIGSSSNGSRTARVRATSATRLSSGNSSSVYSSSIKTSTSSYLPNGRRRSLEQPHPLLSSVPSSKSAPHFKPTSSSTTTTTSNHSQINRGLNNGRPSSSGSTSMTRSSSLSSLPARRRPSSSSMSVVSGSRRSRASIIGSRSVVLPAKSPEVENLKLEQVDDGAVNDLQSSSHSLSSSPSPTPPPAPRDLSKEDDVLEEIMEATGVSHAGIGKATALELFMQNITNTSPLALFSSITSLSLIHHPSLTVVRGLDSLTSLRHVSICHTAVPDFSWISPAVALSLQSVHFSDNALSSLSSFPSSLPALHTLWVNNNDLQDNLSVILKAAPVLSTLWASGNPIHSVKDVVALAQAGGALELSELGLAGTALDAIPPVASLCTLPKLRRLTLSDAAHGSSPVVALSHYSIAIKAALPGLLVLDGHRVDRDSTLSATATVARKHLFYSMRVASIEASFAASLAALASISASASTTIQDHAKSLMRLIKALDSSSTDPSNTSLRSRATKALDARISSKARLAAREEEVRSVLTTLEQGDIARAVVEDESLGNIRFASIDVARSDNTWLTWITDVAHAVAPEPMDLHIHRAWAVTHRASRLAFDTGLASAAQVSVQGGADEEVVLGGGAKSLFTHLQSCSGTPVDSIRVLAGAPSPFFSSMSAVLGALAQNRWSSGNLALVRSLPSPDTPSGRGYWLLCSSTPGVQGAVPEVLVEASWGHHHHASTAGAHGIVEMELARFSALAKMLVSDDDGTSGVLATAARHEPRREDVADGLLGPHHVSGANDATSGALVMPNARIQEIGVDFMAAALSTQLRVLDLAFNELRSLDALSGLSTLEELDVTGNALVNLDGFKNVKFLNSLKAGYNAFARLEVINSVKKAAPSIAVLELQGNPMSAMPTYRATVLRRFPSLLSLDGDNVAQEPRLPGPELTKSQLIKSGRSDLMGRSDLQMASLSGWRSPSGEPAALEFIQDLNLNGLGLRKLPSLGSKLTRVRRVSLAHNDLGRLSCLSGCLNLEELCASYNRLGSLEGLENLPSLKHLDVSHNSITSLEPLAESWFVSPLTCLKIRANNISRLDSLVTPGLASSLVELYAGQNSIHTLSEMGVLAKARNLLVLELSGCPGAAHAEYRGYMVYHVSNLEVLDGFGVSTNEQSEAREQFSGRLSVELLEEKLGHGSFGGVIDLNVSGIGLREASLLAKCGRFRALSMLNLSRNLFVSPSSLAGLGKQIVELTLDENKLSNLNGLGSLTRLATLSVDMNELVTLSGISSCSHLTRLSVVKNKLVSLSGIDGLSSLVELIADGNRIKGVESSEIRSLTGLRELRLSDNLIRSPGGLGLVGGVLQALHIGGNRLSELAWICSDKFPSLVSVTTAGNPAARRRGSRIAMIRSAPGLRVIDGRVVSGDEREKASAETSAARAAALLEAAERIPAGKVPVRVQSMQFDAVSGLVGGAVGDKVGGGSSSGSVIGPGALGTALSSVNKRVAGGGGGGGGGGGVKRS